MKNVIKIYVPMDYVDLGFIGTQAGESIFDVPNDVQAYAIDRLIPILKYACTSLGTSKILSPA